MNLSDPESTRVEALSNGEPRCADLPHLTHCKVDAFQTDTMKLYAKAHGAKVDLPPGVLPWLS